MSGLVKLFRAFRRDTSGNFVSLFALGAVSVIGVTGMAVDYSRAVQMRASIYAAADSAALAAARTMGTAAEREKVAKDVFAANTVKLTDAFSLTMSPENITKDGANYGYRVRASGSVKTFFSGMFGLDQVSMDVLAEAISTISSKTEIALVLDTTGSMSGWKMDTLKKAAGDMVETLSKLSAKPDQLKFSVVPFAEYVNVGLANRNKPWMNVPADYQDPPSKTCWKHKPVVGEKNCTQVWVPPKPGQPPGTCYNDGVPYSCGGSQPKAGYYKQVCEKIYGPEEEKCNTSQGAWHKWHGCVGSRNHPLDTQDGSYGNKIPGLMDTWCSDPLLELTSDFSKVKNTVKNLSPSGNTYIPAGLIWGWRTLSAQEPFSAATSTPTEQVRKFLVLMTDGMNTRSPTYPQHWGSDTAKSNDLVKKICTNIAADKTSEIQIYTVAFDVSDTTIKTLLKDCAANTKGQFFDAQNKDQFLAAFSKISDIIAELRLSK
ncbi:MAG: pilus assembly protein TadG-related protein [Beijerinckiaceae bacterium]|nr:pilus assembly protein TadG-related protein [Beijerinckiaceae bacterium]